MSILLLVYSAGQAYPAIFVRPAGAPRLSAEMLDVEADAEHLWAGKNLAEYLGTGTSEDDAAMSAAFVRCGVSRVVELPLAQRIDTSEPSAGEEGAL